LRNHRDRRRFSQLRAAIARNGVIGADNRLLWRLSNDLRRFKALTLGKPLVDPTRTVCPFAPPPQKRNPVCEKP
jgi:dihydrofolate reductase